ncbi:MAG TPA: spermidine synthase [Verrucomicrobia bacterium]|nr:spermidine synthase [Verrucomicrobiota bacterium]
MKPPFEELDYRQTAMGELILQRRRVLALDGAEAYEVKLNGEYLMSSLFHVAETELSKIGLGALKGEGWEVVVGGLGLGYTAAEALAFPHVARLVVVEALEPVIDWHRRGLVPNGKTLTDDPRCSYLNADFFALARGGGFDPKRPGRRWNAVLLDIDHTPSQLLNKAHADFYSADGLRRLKEFLKPGGVFAMWSNDEPDAAFLEILRQAFGNAEGRACVFDNPLTGEKSANGLYLARAPGDSPA